MNPPDDITIQIQDIQNRIQTLENMLATFTNTSQIDPLIQKAITAGMTSGSTKTATSGTQSVDEGGTATYSVMKAPDGFITVGGKNIPYIN